MDMSSPTHLPARRGRLVGYGGAFFILFGLALWIALGVDDAVIRPFGGDVLVIPVLHCLVCALTPWKPSFVASGVLIFACAVELGQAFDLAGHLRLEVSSWMRVAIGQVFDPRDFAAYALGYVFTLGAERFRQRSRSSTTVRIPDERESG